MKTILNALQTILTSYSGIGPCNREKKTSVPPQRIILASLLFVTPLLAEVTADITSGGTGDITFTWNNTGSQPQYLGGVRYWTDGYKHPGLAYMTGWNFASQSSGGRLEQTVVYGDATELSKGVKANGSISASPNKDYSGNEVVLPTEWDLLLKTGTVGVIEKPKDENPIELDQLDSIMALPDFYNADYRFIDTLGANGGTYSGGIMDTWLGETQVITPFTKETFNIHLTEKKSFSLNATSGDPMYWMTLVMGQEYFAVDMQWMMGVGAQETGIGTGSYHGTHSDKAYGQYEVQPEANRASWYPEFFRNTSANPWGDLTSLASCPIDHAALVNGYIFSILAFRYIYDLYNYSSDVCWKEVVSSSDDRFFPLAAMMSGYNRGPHGGAQLCVDKYMNPSVVDTYLLEPEVSDSIEVTVYGANPNNDADSYFDGVRNAVAYLEDGARKAMTDNSIGLLDAEITKSDLERFFFGENGTASTPGVGGLMKHFDANPDSVWNRVDAAFEKMKGKAPSTQNKDAISLRYDFITLLRTVKKYFLINWSAPTPQGKDEYAIWVQQNSGTGGCAGVALDEIYPYGEILSVDIDTDGDFNISVHAWDESAIKDVKYTFDRNWPSWIPADSISGTEKDQNWSFTITKEDKETQYGKATGNFWILVSDQFMNSVVYKGILKGSPLKSASAVDIDGDGLTDSIRVNIVEGALESGDDAKNPTLSYSWPGKTGLGQPSGIDYNNETLRFVPDNSIGAGEGVVELKYPSMTNVVERPILDSVGPALVSAEAFYSPAKENDTVQVVFTESLGNDFNNNETYFIRIRGSNESDRESKEVLKLDDTTYQIIFDYGTVEKNDSLAIVVNGGVKDVKDNKPHIDNRHVPINFAATPTEVELDSAVALDNDGDGSIDFIEVFVQKGSPDAVELNTVTNFKYSWPNKGAAATGTPTVTDSSLIIVDGSLNGGKGTGEVTFDYPNKSGYRADVLDRIGPALVSAKAFYSKSKANDTVQVVFTESLGNSFNNNETYFTLIRGSNESDKESKEVIKLDDTTYQIIFDYGTVEKDDSLAIVVNGGVIDTKDNEPHSDNRHVPIDLVGIPTEVELDSAVAIDDNGDGAIDFIEVFVQKGPADDADELNSVTNFKYSWPNKGATDDGTPTVTDSSLIISDSSLKGGSGEGEVKFDYPSKSEYQTAVLDRIGPALISASCLWSESKENDTVIVEFTENLGNSFNNNETYFTVIRGSNESETESKEVIRVDDSNFKIIFEHGTIQSGDSLAIVVNGGVEDVKGNQPHDDNRHVPLTIIGGKKPKFEQGQMFDSDGDGDADSIEVIISLGTNEPETMYDLDSLFYSWPDKRNWISAGGKEKNDTILNISGLSHSETKGDGDLQLHFPSGTISGILEDRVGPVISEALLWENHGGDDTLQVKFSENVDGISNGDMVIALFGSDLQSKIAKRYIGGNVWLLTFDNGTIQLGDSVSIVANSSLEDSVGNRVHPENRKVEVTLKLRPIGISETESGFLDTDSDGELDRLVLKMNSEIERDRISSFEGVLVWENENGIVDSFYIENSLFDADGSDEITVDLDSFDFNGERTSIESDEYGIFIFKQEDSDLPDGELHETVVNPKDKMAPILVGFASYKGEKLVRESEIITDTLRVTFSEEIRNPKINSNGDSTIFVLAGENGEYRLNITDGFTSNGVTFEYLVESDSNTVVIPTVRDSIRIDGNGQIEDIQGNVQNRKTPYIPFDLVFLPADYEIVVYPNPFVLESSEPNELLEKHGFDGDGRLAIMVRPYGDRAGEEMEGYVTLHDAVGNVVADRQQMELTNRGALLYHTDGTNTQGRALGSGAYRGYIYVVSETDGLRQEDRFPIMIGIRK